MEENYTDAAFRHWNDAQLLEKEDRVENADQLYGLAAECAIKKILVNLPAFANQGNLDKSFKEHINLLWDKVNHQSLQKSYPGLAAFLKAANPFSSWNVDKRYFADGSIKKQELKDHREAAKRLLGIAGLHGGRRQ